jgi:hypothetical protein
MRDEGKVKVVALVLRVRVNKAGRVAVVVVAVLEVENRDLARDTGNPRSTPLASALATSM